MGFIQVVASLDKHRMSTGMQIITSHGLTPKLRDIAIHAKEILRVRERLNMIYQKHMTKPHSLEEIEKIMERDLFMGAETALEMGIVDEILIARKPPGSEEDSKDERK